MSGLPIPSKDYFPKPFQDYNDPGFVALTNKIDSVFTGVLSDLVHFRDIRRVEKMPRSFLNALGYMLVANILDADTDRQAARKVYRALAQRKYRSTWFDDIKPKIDNISGTSAVIFSPITEPDWIILAGLPSDPVNYWGVFGVGLVPATDTTYFPDEFTLWGGAGTDPTDYQGILGTNGVDLGTGPLLIGGGTYGVDPSQGVDIVASGTESEVSGNIYIDLVTNALTADRIQQIVQSIQGSVPAYFRIYLGYTSGSNFTVYSGGIVG